MVLQSVHKQPLLIMMLKIESVSIILLEILLKEKMNICFHYEFLIGQTPVGSMVFIF